MDYDKDLLDDVVAFLEDMKDEIKTALIDGTEFDDIYNGDMRYRMEESIYTSFSLEDAIYVIDNCENEETDSGLWEGLDPSDAIIAMAVYSYRADAWSKAAELYDEMVCELEDYLEGFDDPDDEFIKNAAHLIWNGFIDRHTIQQAEPGGVTELTILEHWVRLNNAAGMWSGYSMPEVKNFVDCDRTVRYQLPHMTGKYCADVEVRIDELKALVMTDNDKHHAKLDELIGDARKEMHRMMDRAIASCAVSDEMSRPDTDFLSCAIITIYGDERNYAPPSIIMNREIDEIAKVL